MNISQTILFLTISLATAYAIPHDSSQFAFQAGGIRVPVELGVMSRCPDALVCETIFDQVLKEVGREKMDLALIYVAELNSTEADFGVTCMHGPGECAGNVQQLCAAKYASPSQWWEFVRCQNSKDVALQCAKTVGIDWETSGVGNCAGLSGSGKGKEGVQLLRKSLLRSKALGIEKSCTVLINRKKVCVHDETWKECEGGTDFVKQINSEYERMNANLGR
ncbi:hypothetical protein B0H13DRAFT_2234878 [Mycena leptocephala]|nr:hypothetical protein B0H13DRAFT_2234878 [Mycena leptocephala]